MVGSTARPSITGEVSLTQNNGHYVRHASRHRLRVGSILGVRHVADKNDEAEFTIIAIVSDIRGSA